MAEASRRPVHAAARAVVASVPDVEVHSLPPAARYALRLGEADARALADVAGFSVDRDINRFGANGALMSARLGPDEWLLIGPEAEAEALAAGVAAALGTRLHALVDIGHRNAAFEVSGRGAAATINAGCPLDLDIAAFPTGMATRTLLGRAEIVLMRTGDEPTYRVECWRSFARYVGAFLAEAVRGVGTVT